MRDRLTNAAVASLSPLTSALYTRACYKICERNDLLAVIYSST